MFAKAIRRITLIIPAVMLTSLLAFSLLYFSPGSAAMLILRERTNSVLLTERDVAEFAEKAGLDTGVFQLYAAWFGGVLRGDLGTSYVDGQNINSKITGAIGKTLKLAMIALAVYIVAGTMAGMLSAVCHNGIFDKITKYWTVLSTAIPVFWLSLFVVWLFSVKLKILTTVGKRGDLSLIFPGALMGLVYTGNLIIIVKEKTRLVLEETFVLNARALGVRKHVILRCHVLKNVLAPIIAASTLAFSNFISFGILMESIFSLSGFGTLLRDAITVKEYMVVAGAILVLGIVVCTVNMFADIAYGLIDRRADSDER
jgi:peptide/nickel transport system permease protein